MFFFNPFLLIIGLLLTIVPQFIVKGTFSKYSKIPAGSGRTGADIAKALLADAGIYNVNVEPIQGQLTDHYDPTQKVLRLSEDVYYGNSISALGVAAHEVGHAIQDNKGYVPMQLRAGIFPVVMFGQTLAPLLLVAGLALRGLIHIGGISDLIAMTGIVLYGAVVLFQIITLPVELNASNRAIKALAGGGYIAENDVGKTRTVLNAAAFTYVAAALYALIELLYWIWILFGRGNRD